MASKALKKERIFAERRKERNESALLSVCWHFKTSGYGRYGTELSRVRLKTVPVGLAKMPAWLTLPYRPLRSINFVSFSAA